MSTPILDNKAVPCQEYLISVAKNFCDSLINSYQKDIENPFKSDDGLYHYVYLTYNLQDYKFYVGHHSDKELNNKYRGSGVYINRNLKQKGRQNFQHIKLKFFQTREEKIEEEKKIVNQEYISLYRDNLRITYNLKIGGEDGARYSQEVKDKMSKLHLEIQNRPEIKARKASEWKDPKIREKRIASLKESLNRPENKLKRSVGVKKALSSEEARQKLKDRVKEAVNKPGVKEKISESVKKLWASEEYRNKQKETYTSKEHKEKLSLAIKESQNRPETKLKRSKSLKEAQAFKPMYDLEGTIQKVHKSEVLQKLKENWKFAGKTANLVFEEKDEVKCIAFIQRGTVYDKNELLRTYLENGWVFGYKKTF